MKALKRSPARALLPHRQSWHNLGAYASAPKAAEAWKQLRARDAHVEAVVAKFGADARLRGETQRAPVVGFLDSSRKHIDWEYWEKNIGHSDIVKNMKEFYEQQKSVLNAVAGQDHTKAVHDQTQGWDLFDDAVTKCEKSVEASENLVANGARGLWVSYHNPPVSKVDDNEWLDSDRSWQAIVEKQFLNNPTASVAEEDLPKWKQVLRDGWRFKMETFNARSDTPVLYQYMDQLPSWEYYDIHRRAFLEHMVYYLLRTGGDYRLFPECPPPKWLAHIEELRYQLVAVAQRRRSELQLRGELRECPLDLQPLDSDHQGEAFVSKFLQGENQTYETVAARLMANYMFLCHPYIPVQTADALYGVLSKYASKGGGMLYSLGDEVNALFYLPAESNLPTPRQAYNAVMDHCALTGRRLNPTYATMLDVQTQILESRGEHWLTAPGECVCDAFMRRLQKNDPSYSIYQTYVSELKERFEAAEEVPQSKMVEAMARVEENYRREVDLFEVYQHASDPRYIEGATSELARLQQLSDSSSLQRLVDEGSLVAAVEQADGTTARITLADDIMKAIGEFSEMKQLVNETVKSLKVGIAETAAKTPGKLVGDFTGSREDLGHLESHLKQATEQ